MEQTEPTHNRATFTYSNKDRDKEIQYYYPSNLTWNCTRCGQCCQDIENHKRTILLLQKDINRIDEKDFHKPTDEPPFKATMNKINGKCVFLQENSCTIYDKRALICHMYPFYLIQEGDIFIINTDPACPGINKGKNLDEEYFKQLLDYALHMMDY